MKLVMELVAGSVVTDMYNMLLPSQTYLTESERVGACILIRLHDISTGVLTRTYEV